MIYADERLEIAQYDQGGPLDRHQPSTTDGIYGAVGQWIGQYPKITIGAAVCLGVVLGWWIKRK